MIKKKVMSKWSWHFFIINKMCTSWYSGTRSHMRLIFRIIYSIKMYTLDVWFHLEWPYCQHFFKQREYFLLAIIFIFLTLLNKEKRQFFFERPQLCEMIHFFARVNYYFILKNQIKEINARGNFQKGLNIFLEI